MKSWVALVGVLFLGCGDGEIDPSEIPTGIYALRIDERIETCDPPKAVGELPEIGIFANDMGLSVVSLEGRPNFTYMLRHFLPRDQGYQLTTGRGIEVGWGCPGGDITFVTHRQVGAATSGGFVVNEKTDWTVTVPCPDDPTVIHAYPQQSCRSEVDQHYELLEVCDEPCWIRQELRPGPLFGDISCVCPGDPGFERDPSPSE